MGSPLIWPYFFLLLGYVVKGPYIPKQLVWFSPLKIYICIAAHISSWTITDQPLQLNRLKGLHIRVYGYHGGDHRLLARVESCSHRAYPPRPCVIDSLELMARNTTFDQQQVLSNLNWPSSSLLLVSSSWFWIKEGGLSLGTLCYDVHGPKLEKYKDFHYRSPVLGILCWCTPTPQKNGKQ